jgi:cell division protein FtsW
VTAIRTDVGPRGPVSFPDTGLGKDWEGPTLALTALAILLFGIVNLYSASAFLAQRQDLPDTFYVVRQIVGSVLGLGLLVVCARVPYGWWRGLAWPLVIASVGLLVFLVLPFTTSFAPEINGSRRWAQLPGFSFQPSEFAKLAIIIWTAHIAMKKEEHFRSFTRGMLPFLIVWAAIVVPIILQPNFSTAVIVGAVAAITLFVAGARIGHFVFVGVLVSPIAVWQLTRGFRMERLLAFRNPEEYLSGAGYQVNQSLVALGSGGPLGVGFGQGRQKFGFLPEPHNDFIFSMIGEEWGLIGVGGLIALYMGVVLVGFRIARTARDRFGQVLAVGLTSMIALHAVLHMSVALGLVPPTGLPLPLVSYGRSNLLVSFAAIGILLSVARGRTVPPSKAGARVS